MRYCRLFGFLCVVVLVSSVQSGAKKPAAPATIELTFTDKVSALPFSGRVFLIAAKQPAATTHRQGWFNPVPFFAQEVKSWKPGDKLTFVPEVHFPKPYGELPPGKYKFQAIMDLDLGGQNPLSSAGNGYSKFVAVELGGKDTPRVELTLDQVLQPRQFKEKERVKLVEIESKLLSEFHGKPMRLRAGVALPKSHASVPKRQYPVIYEIPGFGGDHFGAQFGEGRTALGDVDVIYVVLDPSCRLGHHVFADSDNNGPVGKALVEELIPHIEKTHRGLAFPGARIVTGHSSGGWSSLWLQITYPDFFGGCWSTAPDSVDFRDFQRVNVYKDDNIFFDADGKSRPLARRGDKIMLEYKPFADMEHVFRRGGQLFSFEAVFGPKGKDGWPLPVWDRATGKIDHAAAKTWERFDIRLILERNWATLGPKLKGKIHIYMGAEDTFYLDGATVLLQKSLKDLGSDAVVEVFPGKDHGSLMDKGLRQRIAKEMAESLRPVMEAKE
ncbi:MAG: hypothetical protein L0Y72_02870 [Gemmataceae bacterium]|nr:hypothetical protein [Gemmataceae bacterium]MCI0737960.1 hypothetical protein [Gemmataceae bacterium]